MARPPVQRRGQPRGPVHVRDVPSALVPLVGGCGQVRVHTTADPVLL